EVTVLIEPQARTAAIFLFGGGHCSLAIARLAVDCGLHVTVADDRRELSENFPETVEWVTELSAPNFIGSRKWAADEAIMLVSRRSDLDRDALGAALKNPGAGYVGMIGSARKVRRVFDELRADGITQQQLESVYAPIGLDIEADSPAEIAISVLAEFLKVTRRRSGAHLRDRICGSHFGTAESR
ncbi:MAG: XdhC family protein, partial [Verrucomicrobiota bacterium]|nr:XdhC family protein [Verrucomicrobiota bacterium]